MKTSTDELLSKFAKDVYFVSHDLEPATQRFYLWKIDRFANFLTRPARLSDLNDMTINGYLAARMVERARETVRGERAVLIALWQNAYDERFLEIPPGRVRLIKKVARVVEGWTPEQLTALLEVAGNRPGVFKHNGISRGAFWRAVVLTLYDTGLRLGDLMNLDAAQLTAAGSFTVIQRKTGKPVDVPLSEQTWEAIKAINPRTRKKPFGDVLCRRNFFEFFAAICKEAGLEGRTKKLRITSGSQVESEYPGEGHLHLGNGRQVFDAHYHWRAVTKRPTRLPPRFDR